jgi:Glycosyl hydrolase family 76
MHQIAADRALATYAAMQAAFYVSRQTGLYRETAPHESGNAFAYVWPHSRAVLGTLALAGIPGLDERAAVKDRIDALAWYWDGRAYASYVQPPYGSGGDRYSDDNTWIALALLQAHRMGLNPSLRRAQQVFTYLQTAWDSRAGGLYWVEQGRGYGRQNHDRGAGATAGAAMLGFQLGASTMAQRMVDWVRQELDASADRSASGPFYNAVRRDGSIDTNIWSYNQGVMLGAYVARYRATGEVQALQLGENIARTTLDAFGDFTHQPPSFNAMCFQNLLMLHAATGDTNLQLRIQDAMHAYAEWTWNPETGARDPQTNLYYFTDAGAPNRNRQSARLQDQGAMLQLYALMAWSPGDYDKLT